MTYSFIPQNVSEQTKQYVKAVYEHLKSKGQITKENQVIYESSLLMLCYCYENYINSQNELMKHDVGFVYEGENGQPRSNPLLNIVNMNLNALIKCQQELGLSIRTRDKIKQAPKEEKSVLDFLNEESNE